VHVAGDGAGEEGGGAGVEFTEEGPFGVCGSPWGIARAYGEIGLVLFEGGEEGGDGFGRMLEVGVHYYEVLAFGFVEALEDGAGEAVFGLAGDQAEGELLGELLADLGSVVFACVVQD